MAEIGDPRCALEVVDRVERSSGGVESEWPRAAVAVFGAFHCAEQWSQRRRALERQHAEARASGDGARAALCELAFARLAVPAGDLEVVRRQAEDALARLAFMDPRAMAPVCHAVIAEVEAIAGHASKARAALQSGYALIEGARPNALAREQLQMVRVYVLAAEGDRRGAQAIALAGAAAAGEAILTEAEFLHLYMRVGGAPSGAASRLHEIAAASRAGMAALWARQAIAARDGDGAGLEEVATEYERVGARIFAAEAAAQAAIAHGAQGSDDARRRAEGRAARLAAACGAHGLTLVTSMRISALTAREQETAHWWHEV